MPNLDGIQYFLFAGLGAIVGLLICALILFPISFFWPPIWDAAFWVIGGFTAAGLFAGAVIR